MLKLFYELLQNFFLCIFIGFFIGFFFKNLTKKISKPLINYGIPILISASLFGNKINKEILFPFVLGILFISFQFLIFYYKQKINNKLDPNLFLTPLLGNTGYIGLPICFLFLSKESFLYAVTYDIGSMLATWGLIPFFLSKDLDNKFNLKLNSITQFILNIPAIRGLILFAFLKNFATNSNFEFFFKTISTYISFFALIYLGIFIGELSKRYSIQFVYKEINIFNIIYKLLISPLLILFICIFIDIDNKFYPSLIIQAAMPTGISALLISEKYKFETKKIASNIIITTTLSIVTIPCLIYLLK